MRKLTETSRFYVVIPQVVMVPQTAAGRRVSMPCGMAAAQAVHAVSQLRMAHAAKGKGWFDQMAQPITTIVLQCRDYREMNHVMALAKERKIPFETFLDSNDGLYGKGVVAATATAFGPCDRTDAVNLFDYLPLWDCEHRV